MISIPEALVAIIRSLGVDVIGSTIANVLTGPGKQVAGDVTKKASGLAIDFLQGHGTLGEGRPMLTNLIEELDETYREQYNAHQRRYTAERREDIFTRTVTALLQELETRLKEQGESKKADIWKKQLELLGKLAQLSEDDWYLILQRTNVQPHEFALRAFHVATTHGKRALDALAGERNLNKVRSWRSKVSAYTASLEE